MEKSAFKKYFYLVLLIFTFLLICIYLIVCTPLVFYRKTGILVVSLTSHVLWTVFSYILNSTFEVEIDDKELEKIEDYENVIVISNHTGAFDFMVISEVSKRKKMLRHAKYMVKESIKYVPILGYVQYLGFMMLKRNFAKDESIIRNWLDYFCKNNVPFWLVIYPEGTRITPKKKAISDKFCDENNLQKLQNVLYPRTGGFKLSCECLKDHVKHVIDLTVYYENKHDLPVPSLLRFIFGMPEGKIKIRINVHKLAKIEDYSEFVKERFYEKDSLIQKWKEAKNK